MVQDTQGKVRRGGGGERGKEGERVRGEGVTGEGEGGGSEKVKVVNNNHK